MKKIFIIIFFIKVLSPSVFADTYVRADADQYTVTIQSVRMCENAIINSETSFSVSGCITLGNSSLTVDITSTTAGSTIGKYADTNLLVAGTTYRYFVPTISRTFTIAGGAVVDSRLSGTFTCNTDEDATFNTEIFQRHLTQRAGKVGGLATAVTAFVPSETTDGITCLNQNCTSSSSSMTFTHDIPDDTTLYGNSINVSANDSDNFEMIYTISTPFTMKDTPPVINMSFGTKGALEVESTVNSGADACRIGPFFPKFRVTVGLPN